MNAVEAGFDRTFDAAIRTEQYNKWPANEYNAVMEPLIVDLETSIREVLR